MKFFEIRREEHWRRDVYTATAEGYARPVPTLSTPGFANIVFPYASLQALTVKYLGRAKTQAQTNQRLHDWISRYPTKEVAFAACVANLSLEAVKKILETDFAARCDAVAGVGQYLQAFVAAATVRSTEFAADDRSLATALVKIAHTSAGPAPYVIHDLLSAWIKHGSPVDATLQAKALVVTEHILRKVPVHLEYLRRRCSWHEAVRYRAPLELLASAIKRGGEQFQACVDASFLRWRSWVQWEPDLSNIAGPVAPVSWGRFGCLLELEGPDVGHGSAREPTVRHRLVRRKQLVAWLEGNNIRPGVGLIVGDTESLSMKIMQHFYRVVAKSVSDGRTSGRLLELFIEREGVDTATLTAWEDALKMLVKQLPDLAGYIVDTEKNQKSRIPKADVAQKALELLSLDGSRSFRHIVVSETARYVEAARNSAQERALWQVALEKDWLDPASALWTLRRSMAESSWLHPSLDAEVVEWVSAQPDIRGLQVLSELFVSVKAGSDSELKVSLVDYMLVYVAQVTGSPEVLASLPGVLHQLWIRTHDTAPREAALTIVSMAYLPLDVRRECIGALSDVPGEVAGRLRESMQIIQEGFVEMCLSLARSIETLSRLQPKQSCWAALLWHVISANDISVDQVAFTKVGFRIFRDWIAFLREMYGDKLANIADLDLWQKELGRFWCTLEELESTAESRQVIHRLLVTTDAAKSQQYVKMLERLNDEHRKSRREFMISLFLWLQDANHHALCSALYGAASLPDGEFEICETLLRLSGKDKGVGAAYLAIRLNMSEIAPETKSVLTSMGEVLGLQSRDMDWASAKKHYETRVQSLLDRARTLETMRMAVTRAAHTEVETMMTKLHLEVPMGVAGLVAELPAELADVIEDVADDQIEMHFTLNRLNSITRLAHGVKGTDTVVVTLRMMGGGVIDGFCVHLEETVGSSPVEHKFFELAEKQNLGPHRSCCPGKQTRLTYIVARTLWSRLTSGEYDIATLYADIRSAVQDGANRCMVCTKDLETRLHRATTCGSIVCSLSFRNADFSVRAELVRFDGRVVDLLLTAVYSVAITNKLDLLIDHPSRIQGHQLLALLNALPPTAELEQAVDMQLTLRKVHRHAEVLFSWLCTGSRTFIMSASGQYRVPNMPGIHQFLVVNNPPEIEAAFAKHRHLQPRMVLFHGTSMDRLYAILVQGLRVLSHTPLMRHGAASGAGIYFSLDT